MNAARSPALSVIVPAHDRPRELERCLRAIADQDTAVPFEVIVVDDGSDPPISLPAEMPRNTRLVRQPRAHGPAAARNLGAASARGAVLVFTDDDTIPSRGWLAATDEHLNSHPEHLAVEGPTESPPYDRLTEHSVENRAAGSGLTCNLACRRDTFEELGGFYEGFPFPHCEDLDFAFRLTRIGEIGYAPEMNVVHPAHPMTVAQEVRRARMIASEIVLRVRHADLFSSYRWLPVWLRPIAGLVRGRARLLRAEWAGGRLSVPRATRWAAVSAGQAAVAMVECSRFAGRSKRRRPSQV